MLQFYVSVSVLTENFIFHFFQLNWMASKLICACVAFQLICKRKWSDGSIICGWHRNVPTKKRQSAVYQVSRMLMTTDSIVKKIDVTTYQPVQKNGPTGDLKRLKIRDIFTIDQCGTLVRSISTTNLKCTANQQLCVVVMQKRH